MHNLVVDTIRRLNADDAPFIRQMLAVAADWRLGTRWRSTVELMAVPELAHYVADWPRQDDFGFVATNGALDVGAAWCRLFTEQDRGYGFVEEGTPELSIGVVCEARGRGVGTRLLRALIEEAQEFALPALSLSVEKDNPAASLYESLGFETVSEIGGSLTMVLRLLS